MGGGGDGFFELAVVFLASAAVVTQTALICDDSSKNYNNKAYDDGCKGYVAWALACSCLSFIVAAVCLIWMKCCSPPGSIGWVGLFLTLLWCGGTGTMTFESPYKHTGNGYFGAWIALVASCLLILHLPAVKALIDDGKSQAMKQGGRWFMVLFLASALVTVQVAVDCEEQGNCDEKKIAWVLACAVVSIFVCILALVLELVGQVGFVEKAWKWVMLFLFAWWCAGCYVATYDTPYVQTGNGYFGCWTALIAATALAASAWGQDSTLDGNAGKLKCPPQLLGVCIFSLACMVAAAKLCDEVAHCDDYIAWATACSAVGFGISLIIIVILFAGLPGSETISQYMWVAAVFFALLWGAGVATMTFHTPFKTTGNGYFGAWFACIFAWSLMLNTVPVVKDAVAKVGTGGVEITLCFLGGLVLWIQAAWECDQSGHCKDELAWALACGLIGFALAVVVITLHDRIKGTIYTILTVILFLNFVGGAGVLTFRKPYTHTGNAYFAVWAGLFGSALLMLQEFGYGELPDDASPTNTPPSNENTPPSNENEPAQEPAQESKPEGALEEGTAAGPEQEPAQEPAQES